MRQSRILPLQLPQGRRSEQEGGLLTFDDNGEIIIVVGRNRSFCPQI